MIRREGRWSIHGETRQGQYQEKGYDPDEAG